MPLNNLEIKCLKFVQSSENIIMDIQDSTDSWLEFGISFLLKTMHLLRQSSYNEEKLEINYKPDGSPSIPVELDIENRLKSYLKNSGFDSSFVGEETGGILPDNGWAIAIDPIDGTRAFLSNTTSYATSLSIYKDKIPLIGLVANPSTSELIYCVSGESTRSISLGALDNPATASFLPFTNNDNTPILVDIHPARSNGQIIKTLYNHWLNDNIRMVRSTGGSPVWRMAESAKGKITYINMWAGGNTQPYDLTAGVLIVIGAGGHTVDVAGNEIDMLSHNGPFITGVIKSSVSQVLKILNDSL